MFWTPPITYAVCASSAGTYAASSRPAFGFAPSTIVLRTVMLLPCQKLNMLRVRASVGGSSRPLVNARNVAPLPSNVSPLRLRIVSVPVDPVAAAGANCSVEPSGTDAIQAMSSGADVAGAVARDRGRDRRDASPRRAGPGPRGLASAEDP